ncbi:MAG: 3-isopropylmalate dehydratase small subunit [Gemmatimonadaceae bacterium]|jgi:3-isopropylmalate/(R)-2-methylmalate dehydratase small subunit|nr:3-isopropylmalate dehydratase small subunit [Gemmatimonadaceae bacterium]
MMHAFTDCTARAVLLPRDDVDTDQIIPARFLTTTVRSGLGRALFADWRTLPDAPAESRFALDDPGVQGAQILVAGRNFGCGSSREHAPWALTDWGFRVVIGASFADIFRNNAHKNGLLTVALHEEGLATLHRLLRETPRAAVTVSLREQYVTVGARFRANFTIDPFARRCLFDGVDELGYLLARAPAIAAFEARGAWTTGAAA